MSRSKKRDKSKQKEIQKKRESRLGQELWGIIYLASGLLVLISLVSHFIDSQDNILGPLLGTNLSFGLIFIMGNIPSFIFPLTVIYLGASLFRGQPMPTRNLIFSLFLTFEICVLLAIHNLPFTSQEQFVFSHNSIGNLIVFMLHYIFGSHTFGPYFLTSFALFITVAALFQINVKEALFISWKFISMNITRFFNKMAELLKAPPRKEKEIPKFETLDIPVIEKKSKKDKKAKGDKQPDVVSPDEQDNDKKSVEIDKELAAFRARKNTPVNILTSEQAEDSNVENDDDDEDITIDGVASIDPSLINTESDDEEFGKIPGIEEAEKPKKPLKPYIIPLPDILPDPPLSSNVIDRMYLEENSRTLEKTLMNFGVEGKVVNISPGPVVTRYEIELAPGVKISKVVSLQDDLSMAVGGKKIRIEAPIPGKAAVGIELPNEDMQIVNFKSILESDVFQKSKAKLPVIIGRSISGVPYVTDITKMPHLLIAGQTGAGKSVGINSFICSMLMNKKPDELRLILIDPKKVEMSYYEHIPHLLAPVVTESKEAVKALQWGVMEMTRRYRLLAKVHARNIDSFNKKIAENTIKENLISELDNKRLPFIVIVVDELADLMLTASKDVEGLIQRIAQLARAVGIHLIVATQRPSVDIITGPIKANLTSRIAFRTIQSTDSRTILGTIGAEKLLGKGDMLFLRNGAPDIERFHGSFISEEDVEIIVKEIRGQEVETDKIMSFEAATANSSESLPGMSASSGNDRDEKFEEAARLIVSTGLGSTSLLQRRLKLGYARAGRVMDELHAAGIVGPQEGSKVREVRITSEVLEDMF